jgi:tetratricopeptide (TPR) repeat protein
LEEREHVEEDNRIMEILSFSPEREGLIRSCLNHIENDPFSSAGPRIAVFLSDCMDEHIARRLMRTDAEHYELWDLFLGGIAGLGPPAITLVKHLFKESDPRMVDHALRILEYVPSCDSAEVILQHWNSLWENNKETLLETVRGIGDRRFIPPLKDELKEGEPYEGEIFYLLCLINNVIDPDLKDIKQVLENSKKDSGQRMEKFLKGDMEGLLHEPLEVELRCRRCRREYHYRVERVMIDADSGSNHIMDDIKCKNCGAVNHYEMTPNGQLSLMSYTMLMAAIANKENKLPDDSPISFAKAISVAGKKMSLREAIPYYEKKLERDPKNLTYILGYANTLRNAKRTEDAIPIYQTALEHDPLAVEAYVSLAQIAEIRGDLDQAYHYYERVSQIINTVFAPSLGRDRNSFPRSFEIPMT